VKPRGKGFSTRPRGARRRCIHDPRSMYFARRDRRVRYIEIGAVAGGGRGDRGRSVSTTSTRTGSVTPERRNRDPRTYGVV
jgi:hypothetical protein